jgi:hypothetical protein
VLPADPLQLAKFKDILEQYADFAGFKIKYSKSSMIPVNVPHDEAVQLAEEFELGSMPFTWAANGNN